MGQQLLANRPRIREEFLDLDRLRSLPPASFGRAYVDWMDFYGYSPDTRKEVKFVDDEELAYIMQRYREVYTTQQHVKCTLVVAAAHFHKQPFYNNHWAPSDFHVF